MTYCKMQDLDLRNKRVLIREDFNVPLHNGKISDDQRIRAALPTIHLASSAGAKIMLLSHLGRPTEGQFDPQLSLAPIAQRLSELLKQPVKLVNQWHEASNIEDIVLFENVRFNVGEKKNDDELAKQMAALCDIFIMDAFATAHRAQASTHGVAKFAPIACAGPLLSKELEALTQAIDNPQHPVIAIVGGAKVSSKLIVLEALLQQVDQLIVGGGIANTFIAAAGFNVGQSLYEPDLIDTAKTLLQTASDRGTPIPIPTDVVVAKEFSAQAKAKIKPIADISADDMILDIGPETAKQLAAQLNNAGTIVWNGPLGVFEFESFAHGTKILAQAIADSPAFSIAGGGDTLAAIAKFGIQQQISYISTGGGAFLEFLEGKTLPAVEILHGQQHA